MALRFEAEVTAEIATTYRAQLAAMTGLHDAVMTMLTAEQWTVGNPRSVPRFATETMIGLLTKATKTFRGIHILCERGLHSDALALVPVLMETTVAIAFILQKKSKERAIIYQAHGVAQGLKMLNEWKRTTGLKRKASSRVIEGLNIVLATYMKQVPPGTDVKRHWSGRWSLQEAVKALRNDVMYATLYRMTSSVTHASDFGRQFEADSSADFIWKIDPTVEGFESPSYAARELLW